MSHALASELYDWDIFLEPVSFSEAMLFLVSTANLAAMPCHSYGNSCCWCQLSLQRHSGNRPSLAPIMCPQRKQHQDCMSVATLPAHLLPSESFQKQDPHVNSKTKPEYPCRGSGSDTKEASPKYPLVCRYGLHEGCTCIPPRIIFWGSTSGHLFDEIPSFKL